MEMESEAGLDRSEQNTWPHKNNKKNIQNIEHGIEEYSWRNR